MPAEHYIDKAAEHLASIISQLDSVKEIGELIAHSVLNGKKVYIMDRYAIVDAELVERPSGLILFRSYKDDGNDMVNGDIFILSALHPEDDEDIALLNKARSLGATVISISPKGPLSQSADHALINNGDGKNGVITIPGVDKPFCPVSGIVNVTLAWALAAETTASLHKHGVKPSVFRGEYLAESSGKNSEARKRYLSLGY